MEITKKGGPSIRNQGPFESAHLILTLISFAAILASFLLANSGLEFELKTALFAAVFFLYLFLCFAFYFRLRTQRVSQTGDADKASDSIFTTEVESRLFALEEANEFFGTSLKPTDMFRLVSSRVNELVPHLACIAFFADETKSKLKISHSDGQNSNLFRNLETGFHSGIAGKAFASKSIEIDNQPLLDRKAMPAAVLEGFRSAIAVPLFDGTEVFGVLQMYSDRAGHFDANAAALLEAVSARVAPLFLSSMAFERTLSNALTDPVTNLPNERAFYLVLETQLAESIRHRDDRPLTILAVDIKNFDKLNKKFGHATGDRILSFFAEVTQAQLRKMNFFSRAVNDEFLIILPTVSELIAAEIMERIQHSFAGKPFEISAQETIHLELNFGSATFWRDGETAEQLLRNALTKKQQAKSGEANKVLWFPKEVS